MRGPMKAPTKAALRAEIERLKKNEAAAVAAMMEASDYLAKLLASPWHRFLRWAGLL